MRCARAVPPRHTRARTRTHVYQLPIATRASVPTHRHRGLAGLSPDKGWARAQETLHGRSFRSAQRRHRRSMCAAQVRPQKNSRREGDTDYSVSVQQKGPSGLMTPYAPSPWPFVWCGLCSLPASHWSCRLLFLICRSLTCTPPSVWLRAILPLSAPPVSVCLVWLNTHTNCSRENVIAS